MKIKLTPDEYEFFYSIMENFTGNKPPTSITDLATTAIMVQIFDRLPRKKPAHLKPVYSFGLKVYEAVYIFRLTGSMQPAYASHSFEANVLRKIHGEIHQKVIAQYL